MSFETFSLKGFKQKSRGNVTCSFHYSGLANSKAFHQLNALQPQLAKSDLLLKEMNGENKKKNFDTLHPKQKHFSSYVDFFF